MYNYKLCDINVHINSNCASRIFTYVKKILLKKF